MGKTYRDSYAGWGEERKQRSSLKDFNNRKQEAVMERKGSKDMVFVIINEWTSEAGDVGVEIVGDKYWDSEDKAWHALRDIANSYNVDLKRDEFNIQLGEDTVAHIESEEYYIQELTRG